MKAKRVFSAVAVTAALILTMTSASFAADSAARTYLPLCGVESCSVSGAHSHSGLTYAGHWIGDGHDYHRPCLIGDCTQDGAHLHDGSCYDGHTRADGTACGGCADHSRVRAQGLTQNSGHGHGHGSGGHHGGGHH